MALKIIVPEEVIDEPVMIEIGERFRRRSSTNKEHALGTIYQFSDAGENLFTAEAYAACHGYGCILDDGMFYHVFTTAEKDNLVPVDWPNSKDAEDERIAYEDYFRKSTQTELADGTWRFRIQVGNDALMNTERLIYQESLGVLLTKGEGQALEVKPEV